MHGRFNTEFTVAKLQRHPGGNTLGSASRSEVPPPELSEVIDPQRRQAHFDQPRAANLRVMPGRASPEAAKAKWGRRGYVFDRRAAFEQRFLNALGEVRFDDLAVGLEDYGKKS